MANPEPQQLASAGVEKEPEIHTIPEQFLGAAAKAKIPKSKKKEPKTVVPAKAASSLPGAPAPPKKKGGKKWMLIPIGAILFVAILGVGTWLLLRPTAEPESESGGSTVIIQQPTETETETEPEEADPFADGTFDPTEVKAGDVIRSMTVVSAGMATGTGSQPATAENYEVVFSGQATVSGSFLAEVNAINGEYEIHITPDEASLENLPFPTTPNKGHLMTFTNTDEAKAALGIEDETTVSGTATVTIDVYTVASAPAEVRDSARLISASSVTLDVVDLSVDEDGDGLTLAEEQLYGTSDESADTDKDGFTDQLELENLYNPAGFKPTRLLDAGLVKTHESEEGYTVLYPSPWIVDETSETVTVFEPPDPPEEPIAIYTLPNQEGMILLDWYLNENPNAVASEVEQSTTKSGETFIIDDEGHHAYLSGNGVVYLFQLDDGLRLNTHFFATYRMMVNSFSLKQ